MKAIVCNMRGRQPKGGQLAPKNRIWTVQTPDQQMGKYALREYSAPAIWGGLGALVLGLVVLGFACRPREDKRPKRYRGHGRAVRDTETEATSGDDSLDLGSQDLEPLRDSWADYPALSYPQSLRPRHGEPPALSTRSSLSRSSRNYDSDGSFGSRASRPCVEWTDDDDVRPWTPGGGVHPTPGPGLPGRPGLPVEPELPGEPLPPEPLYLAVRAIYIAQGIGLIEAIHSALAARYNILVLGFWFDGASGTEPGSAADVWAGLPQAQRAELRDAALAAGARIILGVAGPRYGLSDKDYPPALASAYGAAAAQFALDNQFLGLDFMFVNLVNNAAAMTRSGMTTAQLVQWLVDATLSARTVLDLGLDIEPLVTHSPLAPYFAHALSDGSGTVVFDSVYLRFWRALPPKVTGRRPVDRLLIQYYDQVIPTGPDTYRDVYGEYDTQMQDNGIYSGTAIGQLIAAGIEAQYVVMAKLTTPNDGIPITYVPPGVPERPGQSLHHWFLLARYDHEVYNWQTGFAAWHWDFAASPVFIRQVLEGPDPGP